MNDELLKRYAGGFDKAVTQVFGAGRQYPELERELRINAGRFGTYKTYDLCRHLQEAREAGLSLDEFKEFAGGTIGVFNGYQKTEYNTLVARARTAKQWEGFRSEQELYPNIEWLRTSSTDPRPEHLAYDGLILPMDDPFWENNQPGNLYNCKCDWRTTDKAAGERPGEDKIDPPNVGLEGNPALTGELITERHPYFRRNSAAPGWVNAKALLQLPDEVAFVEKTTATGGKYLEHLLVSKAEEAAGNRAMAEMLLQNGFKDVKLLPQINQTEKILRKQYFGKEYAEKHLKSNPDAMIGDKLIEFKSSNRNNLSKHILNAAHKSDIVLVRLTEPMTKNAVTRFINSQWSMQDRENLTEIMLHVNSELCAFKRPK